MKDLEVLVSVITLFSDFKQGTNDEYINWKEEVQYQNIKEEN